MAVELVGIETCYRHEEEIPPRFKPCPYAAAAAAATTAVAAKITAPFREPAIAALAAAATSNERIRFRFLWRSLI